MLDKRVKSEAAKLKTRRARDARREVYRRERYHLSAAQAAAAAGFPLNFAIMVSWSALGIDDARGAELALWSALRSCAAGSGFPWVALRAPEKVAGRGGRHVHFVCHVPDDAARLRIIQLIAEKTAAPPAWVSTEIEGRRLQDRGHRISGVMNKSRGGEWLVQRNIPRLGGIDTLVKYDAKASGKAAVDGQHRLSQKLKLMMRTRQISAHGLPDRDIIEHHGKAA